MWGFFHQEVTNEDHIRKLLLLFFLSFSFSSIFPLGLLYVLDSVRMCMSTVLSTHHLSVTPPDSLRCCARTRMNKQINSSVQSWTHCLQVGRGENQAKITAVWFLPAWDVKVSCLFGSLVLIFIFFLLSPCESEHFILACSAWSPHLHLILMSYFTSPRQEVWTNISCRYVCRI